MYRVNPQKIYAMDRALEDPACVARMERMVSAIGRDVRSVEVIGEAQLSGLVRENGWLVDVRQGAYEESADPDIVFNAFAWLGDAEKAEVVRSAPFVACAEALSTSGAFQPGLGRKWTEVLFGVAPFYHYERRPTWDTPGVCWSLYDLHSAWGCLHRCAYCPRGSLLIVMLNVEAFLDRVDGLMAENPWQKVVRYDVEQDPLPLEPEYGACEILVNHFAGLEDRYLILFSKSANVDFLLPLDHRGHTIMLWTLSSHTASREFEGATATMQGRIEAARKCQEAGYPVRFKFKPIIPLRNWREETTDMLERLFDRVRPDNLSIEAIFFQGGVREMEEVLGLDSLDGGFVAAAVEAEGTPWDRAADGAQPFPHAVKEQVYRYFIRESKRISPSTPVTLCAETQRMWRALDDLIDLKPWNYVCNCGPHCTPGLRRIDRVEGPDAERIEQARALGRIPSDP